MNSVFSIKIAFLQSSLETNKIEPHQKWSKPQVNITVYTKL